MGRLKDNFSTRQLLAAVVVFSLLSSFGLHSIQVPHTHVTPVHAHSGQNHGKQHPLPAFQTLEAVFHTSDKKIHLVLVSSLLPQEVFGGMGILGLLLHFLHRSKVHYGLYGGGLRRFDYLIWYFRKGIFHSKAY